jgi:hypothetical protein
LSAVVVGFFLLLPRISSDIFCHLLLVRGMIGMLVLFFVHMCVLLRVVSLDL